MGGGTGGRGAGSAEDMSSESSGVSKRKAGLWDAEVSRAAASSGGRGDAVHQFVHESDERLKMPWHMQQAKRRATDTKVDHFDTGFLHGLPKGIIWVPPIPDDLDKKKAGPPGMQRGNERIHLKESDAERKMKAFAAEAAALFTRSVDSAPIVNDSTNVARSTDGQIGSNADAMDMDALRMPEATSGWETPTIAKSPVSKVRGQSSQAKLAELLSMCREAHAAINENLPFDPRRLSY